MAAEDAIPNGDVFRPIRFSLHMAQPTPFVNGETVVKLTLKVVWQE